MLKSIKYELYLDRKERASGVVETPETKNNNIKNKKRGTQYQSKSPQIKIHQLTTSQKSKHKF